VQRARASGDQLSNSFSVFHPYVAGLSRSGNDVAAGLASITGQGWRGRSLSQPKMAVMLVLTCHVGPTPPSARHFTPVGSQLPTVSGIAMVTATIAVGVGTASCSSSNTSSAQSRCDRYISDCCAARFRAGPCRLGVKTGKSRSEQMFSGLLPKADIRVSSLILRLRRQLVRKLGPLALHDCARLVRNDADMFDFQHVLM
jgi:hypothetical protein